MGRNISGPVFTVPSQALSNANSPGEALPQAVDNERLLRIEQMIQYCIKNHSKCNKISLSFMPTRLLNITDASKIYLQVAPANTRPYTCLSHRWANWDLAGPPVALTKGSYDSFTNHISFESLPATFQDAIKVSMVLNFQYVWIDSLCIIQDDDKDKSREISQMSSVYSNASLTIAANNVRDNRLPFVTGRETHPSREAHKFSVSDNQGRSYEVYARETVPHSHWWGKCYPEWFMQDTQSREERTSTLFERAWVFQERLLSPRVLNFEHSELVLECRENTVCECRQTSHLEISMPLEISDCMHPKEKFAYLLDRCGADKRKFSIVWRKLIYDYSQLSLTMGTDKLPAVSGIAQEMHQRCPEMKYVAGMWQHSILEDLLWHVNRELETLPMERSKWRAPTWSWASCDAFVFWLYTQLEGESFLGHHVESLRARVLEISCQPKTTHEFGEIQPGACIYLEAQVAPVTVLVSSGKPACVEIAGYATYQKGVSIQISLDRKSSGDCEVKLQCLRVLTMRYDESDAEDRSLTGLVENCLLLRCVDIASQTYERVGELRFRIPIDDKRTVAIPGPVFDEKFQKVRII